MTSARCRALVATVLIAIIALGLVACDAREDQATTALGSPIGSVNPRRVALPRGVSASLPAGWQLVRKPINQVIYPVQVLAAASFPVELGETTPGCLRVLDQKPPGGVLVQVIEYTRQPGLERFPPRERPFRLPNRTYATHTCAGPSYGIVFRDHRRALQVAVILDRHRVDPRIRQQAIDLLSSMRFASPRADRIEVPGALTASDHGVTALVPGRYGSCRTEGTSQDRACEEPNAHGVAQSIPKRGAKDQSTRPSLSTTPEIRVITPRPNRAPRALIRAVGPEPSANEVRRRSHPLAVARAALEMRADRRVVATGPKAASEPSGP